MILGLPFASWLFWTRRGLLIACMQEATNWDSAEGQQVERAYMVENGAEEHDVDKALQN